MAWAWIKVASIAAVSDRCSGWLQGSFGSLFTGGARFGPDGKSLVYIIKDKAANLWMQPLDGSPGHQITNFTADLITGFRWSPDRKTLAGCARTALLITSDVVVLRETNE